MRVVCVCVVYMHHVPKKQKEKKRASGFCVRVSCRKLGKCVGLGVCAGLDKVG